MRIFLLSFFILYTENLKFNINAHTILKQHPAQENNMFLSDLCATFFSVKNFQLFNNKTRPKINSFLLNANEKIYGKKTIYASIYTPEKGYPFFYDFYVTQNFKTYESF